MYPPEEDYLTADDWEEYTGEIDQEWIEIRCREIEEEYRRKHLEEMWRDMEKYWSKEE